MLGMDHKTQPPALELENRIEHVPTAETEVHHLGDKIEGGDEVLEILRTTYVSYTKEEERAVRRKIDRRLIPIMILINGLQFVDKNTISYAGTYGIADEIGLVGQQFSWIVSIFYIAYLLAQYPTNVLMQRFPTGKYITVNFVLWGATLTASTGAKSFATLATGRFFLAVFEACLMPGFVLITSAWWTKEEQAVRTTLWVCANGIFGAPAGVIFYGIAHLTAGGMFPYQWMFLILGLVTVLLGISMWWVLPDSPAKASFLTEREQLIAIERIKGNMTGTKNTQHKREHVIEALTDHRIWLLVCVFFLHNLAGPMQTTFAGIIIKGFGFSTYDAVLLNIPPGICFIIGVLGAGLLMSTKWGNKRRILLLMMFALPGITAALILRLVPDSTANRGVKLFAVYFSVVANGCSAIMYTLLASNIAGYTKKVVSGAMFFVAQAVAQIVAPQAYLATQAPSYQTGINLALGALCALIGVAGILWYSYWRENNRRKSSFEATEANRSTEGTVEDLILGFSDMTDKQNTKMLYRV